MDNNGITSIIKHVEFIYADKAKCREEFSKLNRRDFSLSNQILQAARDLGLLINGLPSDFRQELQKQIKWGDRSEKAV